MTIVSIKIEADGELRRVGLSDGSFFSFRICYLPPSFDEESLYDPDRLAATAEGLELSPEEEEGLRFASACLEAETIALRLIARAEQTAFGLGRKLGKRGCGSDCANTVISRLCDMGLLDDRRYACLWLESRLYRQGSSPLRLLAALRSKGIDRDDAESALREVLDDDAELRLLECFVRKKPLDVRGVDFQGEDDSSARRSIRYRLKSEGFSSLAIERLFDNLGNVE